MTTMLATGCYRSHGRDLPLDAGADPDASVSDSGTRDSGSRDSGTADAGLPTWAPHALCRIVGLGAPRDVEASRDGRLVAIAPANEAVRIMRVLDGAETIQLLGHPRSGASRVRFLHEGGFVTLASDGVRRFDATGALLSRIERPGIRDLDVLPGGDLLALEGTDIVRLTPEGLERSRIVIEPRGGELFGTIELSPDGSLIAVAGRIGHRVFDLNGARVSGVVLGSADLSPPLAWAPSSRLFAIAANASAPPGGTERRTVWMYGTDPSLGSLAVSDDVLARAIAFSADGAVLWVGRDEGVVRYDLTRGSGPVPTAITRRPGVHDTGGHPVVDLVTTTMDADAERAVLVTDHSLLEILRASDEMAVLSHVPLVDVDRGLGVLAGDRLAEDRVVSRDGLWSIATGLPARFDSSAIAVRSDGSAYAREDAGRLVVRDAANTIVMEAALSASVELLSFSPDGVSVGVVSRDVSGAVTLDALDLSGGPSRSMGFGRTASLFTALAIDEGSRHFAIGFDSLGAEVRRFDGTLLVTVSPGVASTPQAVAFVPGQDAIVTALGAPTRWLSVEGEGERSLPPGPEASRALWADARWLVEGGASQTWIRDAITGEVVEVLGSGPAAAVALDVEQRVAVGSLEESIVRLYCPL